MPPSDIISNSPLINPENGYLNFVIQKGLTITNTTRIRKLVVKTVITKVSLVLLVAELSNTNHTDKAEKIATALEILGTSSQSFRRASAALLIASLISRVREFH